MKLRANTKFNKKTAIKFSKTNYYRACIDNLRKHKHILNEKRRLATYKKKPVRELIKKWKSYAKGQNAPRIFQKLQKIFEKNKEYVLKIKRKEPLPKLNKITNVMALISNPIVLMTAYRNIRSNQGAMTKAVNPNKVTLKNLDENQKKTFRELNDAPDGISKKLILFVTKLLNHGYYPWGISKRIYFDKPGDPSKKRPITIPPFMDRVVQEATRMVLEAIYEPWFELRNRAFGFRPNKGTKDAIAALTNKYYTTGLDIAIEGDISAAYDKVNKRKLLEIIGKRIKDAKFFRFLKDRLNYEYYDMETKEITKTEEGIPQGGIDSPYLFNIYMMEFDEFIHKDIQEYLDKLNEKVKKRPPLTKAGLYLKNKRWKQKQKIKRYRDEKKHGKKPGKAGPVLKLENYYKEIKVLRKLNHAYRKTNNYQSNKRYLRLFYVRYADDWILLLNGDKQIAEKIKAKIAKWLQENLSATLSDKKTLITDLKKGRAKFLGYELKIHQGSLMKIPVKIKDPNFPENEKLRINTLQHAGGQVIIPMIEKQRYIDRLYMKGFCDKKGFPREMGWMIGLEPQVIVERFNAVLRGMVNDKAGVVNFSELNRWIYIVRYSCIKTLAAKYHINIAKVLKKYGEKIKGTNTPSFRMIITYEKETFYKDWSLLTYHELKQVQEEAKKKFIEKQERFNRIEKGDETVFCKYDPSKGRTARITDSDYLRQISWVNVRTQASFDAPCALCGATENIEMHHIKHVRKSSYTLIPNYKTWEQVMHLRGRKQIPVCAKCHRETIHAGKYNGLPLKLLTPNKVKMYDNRLVQLENFVKPGNPQYAKSLLEKGWLKL